MFCLFQKIFENKFKRKKIANRWTNKICRIKYS